MAHIFRVAFGTVLAAGLVISTPYTAEASVPSPSKGIKATTGTTAGKTKNSSVLAQLQQAHKLLVAADHDYDGHRAKAAHEVSQAIHELSGAHKSKAGAAKAGIARTKTGAKIGKAKVGTGKASVNGTANKMPQAQSDALLNQASAILAKVVSQIPSGNPAANKVQTAIAEIGTALKIK